MQALKNIFPAVKKSFSRFPAMYVLCLLASTAVALFSFLSVEKLKEAEQFFLPFILDFSWTAVLSILAVLFAERFFASRKSTALCKWAANALALLAAIPFYFFCRSYKTNDYFVLIYCATALAMTSCAGYFFTEAGREKTGANLFYASAVAGMLSACVGTAFSIIIMAVDTLLFDLGDYREAWIISFWAASSYLVFMGAFVSYAAKPHEEISVPKAMKPIFVWTLIPLLTVYVAVLYAYLFKALWTRALPSGFVNPFVSVATASFITIYLASDFSGAPLARFLRAVIPPILLPLIVLQIVSLSIRVSAYGLTATRYASYLYIFFSLFAVVLAALKNFRFKNLNASALFYPALALVCLAACSPKANLFDVADQSMRRQIEAIYKSHNLFADGKIIADGAEDILSAEEKNKVLEAHQKVNVPKNIPWYQFEEKDEGRPREADRKKTFGLEKWRYDADDVYYCGYRAEAKGEARSADISGFSKMHEIKNSRVDENYNAILTAAQIGDVVVPSEQIKALLKFPYSYSQEESLDAPIAFELDGGKTKVILTYIRIIQREADNPPSRVDISARGYVLEK